MLKEIRFFATKAFFLIIKERKTLIAMNPAAIYLNQVDPCSETNTNSKGANAK